MTHLRAWRLAAGLNQDELAARSGVQQSTISLLETGRTASPTLVIAIALVGALNQRLPAPITCEDLTTPPPLAEVAHAS